MELNTVEQKALAEYLIQRREIRQVDNWESFVAFLVNFSDKKHCLENLNSTNTILRLLAQLMDKDEVLRTDLQAYCTAKQQLQLMAAVKSVEDSNVFRRSQQELIKQQVCLIAKIVAHLCQLAGVQINGYN